MENQPAALHMTQEVMSQANTLAGTLDQTGDVRHDKGLFLCHTHQSQHRCQRGKVVVGDLRLCRTDHRDQRGFSHIWKANQSHIRQQL